MVSFDISCMPLAKVINPFYYPSKPMEMDYVIEQNWLYMYTCMLPLTTHVALDPSRVFSCKGMNFFDVF